MQHVNIKTTEEYTRNIENKLFWKYVYSIADTTLLSLFLF
jgi:hypothetical protein